MLSALINFVKQLNSFFIAEKFQGNSRSAKTPDQLETLNHTGRIVGNGLNPSALIQLATILLACAEPKLR